MKTTTKEFPAPNSNSLEVFDWTFELKFCHGFKYIIFF